METALRLSEEGLFPLPGPDGLTSLGLPCPGTLQGEGLLAGVPSLFLRLAGCNMRCVWRPSGRAPIPCDTPYAQSGGSLRSVREILHELLNPSLKLDHLVVTGGEPLLQARALCELLVGLRDRAHFHVTLETNGYLFDAELAGLVDLVSISPKFESVAGIRDFSYSDYHASLRQWIEHAPGVQLKFVVAEEDDDQAIVREFLSHLPAGLRFDVLVMPLGASRHSLAESQRAAISISLRRNWRYSPRLHVDLWGGGKGF